jgi:uncharacterized protein YbaA (DUF1428 family)
MSYVDGFVVPVPEGSKEQYLSMAQKMAGKFTEHGALQVIEAWGDDVMRGKTTDFFMAVKAEEGENVVFSFVMWPDKATRDAAWAKIMDDPEMQPDPNQPMPFDGKRMFWGGFQPIVEVGERAHA